MEVLFICGLIYCYVNTVVKEYLLLYRRQNYKKMAIIGFILASYVDISCYLESAPMFSSPEPDFTEIGQQIKNSQISKYTRI